MTNGCVGEYHSPGTCPSPPAALRSATPAGPLRDRTRTPRPAWSAARCFDHPAVDVEVREDRRARDIHVPHAVMHELVVPLALAGLHVERDQALAEQTRSRDDGRRSNRRSATRRADTRGPAPRPRVICAQTPALPVYDHESFSHVSLPNSPGPRNGVEDPQPLAGLRVEAADVALLVGLASWVRRRQMRGADDDHVVGDERRGVEADSRRSPDPSSGRLRASDRRCRPCRSSAPARPVFALSATI